MNRLLFGDNLAWLRDTKEFPDPSVDLEYLDPPFNSNAHYNALFREASGEASQAQFHAFTDSWSWADAAELYNQFRQFQARDKRLAVAESQLGGIESSRNVEIVVVKRTSPNSVVALLVMILGLLLFAGCTAKDSDAQAKLATVLTGAFGISLPSGFTNVESAYYTYSSMDGGTRVWLQHLAGDSAAATNMLEQLEAKHVTVAQIVSLPEDPHALGHASWWHPEKHMPCKVFTLSTDKGKVALYLGGYVFSTPTNSSAFVVLRERAK